MSLKLKVCAFLQAELLILFAAFFLFSSFVLPTILNTFEFQYHFEVNMICSKNTEVLASESHLCSSSTLSSFIFSGSMQMYALRVAKCKSVMLISSIECELHKHSVIFVRIHHPCIYGTRLVHYIHSICGHNFHAFQAVVVLSDFSFFHFYWTTRLPTSPGNLLVTGFFYMLVMDFIYFVLKEAVAYAVWLRLVVYVFTPCQVFVWLWTLIVGFDLQIIGECIIFV